MTVERIRAVRDSRYKLIRNFMPERPYTQFNEYITNSYPTQKVIKSVKLNAVQAQWMAPQKPEYELYDHQTDPHEVRNLAGSPQHRAVLRKLSRMLGKWIEETADQGRTPETAETIEREEPRAGKP